MSTPRKALALCKKLEKQAEDMDIFDHLSRSLLYEEYELDKGVDFEQQSQ